MLKRRGKQAGIILFSILLFSSVWVLWPSRVFNYDSKVAHPFIAKEAVKLYNQQFDPDITDQEMELIMEGAVAEDTPTRWLNHFYDPVYKRGIWFGKQQLSAKEWIQNPSEQMKFALGDKSWQRALDDFRQGKRELAFQELGHIVHVISDMAVPAHTRNDIHVFPGDSYERYVKNNLADKQSATLPYIHVSNLDEAVESMASYSNENFYSDDTVEDKKYKVIDRLSTETIANNDGVYYKFFTAQNGDERYKLFFDRRVFKWQNLLHPGGGTVSVDLAVDNDTVLADYKQLLVPKAIGYSAGVIKLFMDEAQKASQGQSNLPRWRIGLGGYINRAVGVVVSAAENLKDYLQSKSQPVQPAIGAESGSLSAKITPLPSSDDAPSLVTVVQRPVAKPQGIRNVPAPNIQNVPIAPTADTVVVEQPASPIPPQVYTPTTQPVYVYSYSNGSSGGSGGGIASQPASNQQSDAVIETGSVNQSTITTSTAVVATTTTIDVSETTSASSSVPSDSSSSTQQSASSTMVASAAGTVSSTESVLTDYVITSTVVTTTPDIPESIVVTTSTLDETPTSTSQVDITESPTSTIEVATSSAAVVTTTPESVTSTTSTTDVTTTTVEVVTDGLSREVIINELAWAGTSATYPNDEWIELYNNTDQNITIFTTSTATSWKLLVSGREINWKKIYNTTIPAHGYYLLERTRDEAIKEVPADYVFTLTGGLNNQGEKLELVKPDGTRVDEVDSTGGWFAGDTQKYHSMERLDTTLSGNDPANWQSNRGPRWTPRSYNGGSIYGSPKASNFGFLALTGRQEETTKTLSADDNPHVLGVYEIPSGMTLNIEPGVVIKSANSSSGFDVSGTLNSVGGDNQPVVITSGRDQNFGNSLLDTVVSQNAGEPVAKDWQGIWCHPGSVCNLVKTDLQFGGKDFRPNGYIYTTSISQVIRAEQSVLNLDESSLQDSGGTAVYLSSVTATIHNSQFQGGVLALDSVNSVLDLNNVQVSGFTDSQSAMIVKDRWPALNSISFQQNASDSILLDRIMLDGDQTLAKDIPVIFANLTINPGAVLIIDPGVNVRLARMSDFTVNGTLRAEGTKAEPIIFAPATAGERWGRMVFNNSASVLKYVSLVQGNLSSLIPDYGGGLLVAFDSDLAIGNSQFLESRPAGNSLYLSNTAAVIANSLIGYADKPGLETKGIKIKDGSLRLDNTVFKNLDFGIYNSDTSLPPPLELTNTGAAHFLNVDHWWEPLAWFGGFDSSGAISSSTSFATSTP